MDDTKNIFTLELREYFTAVGRLSHEKVRDRFLAEIDAAYPNASPQDRMTLLSSRMGDWYKMRGKRSGEARRARNAAKAAAE
jgi:hypothetical protein